MSAVAYRMRFRTPEREVLTHEAAWSLPFNWLVLAFVAALCLALWGTSTKLLLTSDVRDGGHVLACRYFTGSGTIERQYGYALGDAAQHACPLIRRGG